MAEKKSEGKSVGFVPTMGALHAGHISLIQEAMLECDLVVCSVFVNPKQFNNLSDLEKYPRNEKYDLTVLENAGCQVVFIPEVEDIYPRDYKPIKRTHHFFEDVYEGSFRPGHFEGVAQVLYRFFSIVGPNRVYFGLKDYQQCLLVEHLLEEHFPGIKLIKCATQREPDGLAMSSRNLRLTPQNRKAAIAFPKALNHIRNNINIKPVNEIILEAEAILSENNLNFEYLEVADAQTLQKTSHWLKKGKNVVIGAVLAGEVRLIDNMVF